MVEYACVESIAVKSLSNKALLQVTRFARILKRLNGRVLSMQDPLLVKHLVQEVSKTSDPELTAIFEGLLPEFHTLAEKPAARR